MNTMRGTIPRVLAIGVLLGMTGVANAALTSILGGQAVYDSTQNITWVADANLASTSGYCLVSGNCFFTDGRMQWSLAQAWIASLNAGSGYLGVTDWRLPNTAQPDSTCGSVDGNGQNNGFNCTGSELGNLFYNSLGGVAGTSIATTHNASYGLFSNVVASYYWSGTEYAPDTSNAWVFSFDGGIQVSDGKGATPTAWAVAPGNIAVPIPGAVWLSPSALGLLGFRRRSA